MIDMIGLLGLLLALIGSGVIAQSMLAMRKLVNSTRPPARQITGFFLLPSSSGPVTLAMKAEHPGHPMLKRRPLGVAMIVVGLAVMTATNSYNAKHN